jgi:hypothetical protein
VVFILTVSLARNPETWAAVVVIAFAADIVCMLLKPFARRRPSLLAG